MDLSKHKKSVAYILPSTNILGGVIVVLQQTNRLIQRGWDAFVLSLETKNDTSWFPNNITPVFPYKYRDIFIEKDVDIAIATGWQTVEALKFMNATRKMYFVQSDERRFYTDDASKARIHNTYLGNFEYFTEAKWIQKWLKDEFGHNAGYVPLGLDPSIHFKTDPLSTSSRPRVLIEGPIEVEFKGMKDAYNAVKDLDIDLWIVSSSAKPPSDWKYDRFFNRVPMNQMREIYSSCDIFLKMSRVEGFFTPPMEAMACGCAVVVGDVTGREEYIKDGYNGLVVKQGDVEGATEAVKRLINNKALREKLVENGYKTAKEWTWHIAIKKLEGVLEK